MNVRNWLWAAATGLVLVAGAVAAHERGPQRNRLSAQLEPTNEVPALSSTASGKFKATVDEINQTITYELSYADTEGVVSQAHIHIGQRGVNGAVSLYLCGNPPAVPAAPVPAPPACPIAPATVTGVITIAHIVGPAAQGIAPSTATTNEFAEVVDMIRSGVTYANVHSSKFPGGEIRGQIRVDGSHKR